MFGGLLQADQLSPTALSKGGSEKTDLEVPSAIRGSKSHCNLNRFAPLVQAPLLSKSSKHKGGEPLSLMEVNGVTCLSLRSHIAFFSAPRIRTGCLWMGYCPRWFGTSGGPQ
jgi:hypothetical protein